MQRSARHRSQVHRAMAEEEVPPKPPVKPAFMPAALRVRRQVRRGDSAWCYPCGREDACAG
jgi:hypothetical protein